MNHIHVPSVEQHNRNASRLKALFQITRQLFSHMGVNIFGNILVHHMRDNSVQQGYYHDSAHMFAVAIEADEIAVYHGLNVETRQALFIASLYHDYGHSYGKQKDINNIHKAIGHFLSHCEKYDFVNNFGIKQETIAIICNMIMCTHYPFVNEPCNYAASILRDADLLMSIQPDVDYFADGLKKEFDNQLIEVNVTPQEMRKFALSQKFYTDYARNKLESYVQKD